MARDRRTDAHLTSVAGAAAERMQAIARYMDASPGARPQIAAAYGAATNKLAAAIQTAHSAGASLEELARVAVIEEPDLLILLDDDCRQHDADSYAAGLRSVEVDI